MWLCFFFKLSLGGNTFEPDTCLGNVGTLYLVERLGVSPVVTLCVLKNAGGTNLDTVTGQLLPEGLRCLFVLLNRQQGQGSRHRGKKETFKGNYITIHYLYYIWHHMKEERDRWYENPQSTFCDPDA